MVLRDFTLIGIFSNMDFNIGDKIRVTATGANGVIVGFDTGSSHYHVELDVNCSWARYGTRYVRVTAYEIELTV